MPYKDPEKQREYQRKWMCEYRKRQKSKKVPIHELRKFYDEFATEAEVIYQKHLLKLEKSPEFQNLSPQAQAETKHYFMRSKRWFMECARDIDNQIEEYYRELKIQLPVVIQKIYRDAYVEVEKERNQLVEKELKRIIGSLTDDQKFELWKLVQTGKLAEKFLESSVKEEISVTRRKSGNMYKKFGRREAAK